MVKIEHLVYKTEKHVYTFQQYETIRSLPENIFAGKIISDIADKDQSDLLNDFADFKKRVKPTYIEGGTAKKR